MCMRAMKLLDYFIICLSLLTITSCGLKELDEKFAQPDIPSYLVDTSKVPITYVLAFKYPSDYDWQKDSEYGYVDCHMLLFANGKKIREITTGYDYSLLPDCDLHKIYKGDVYSRFSDKNGIIILRNGKEIFRYDRNENILSMDFLNGDVYTLGNYKDGKGLAARKNGEVIFELEKAQAFKHTILTSSGDYRFCYLKELGDDETRIVKYYEYESGKSKQIAVSEDIVMLWDAIPGLNYLAKLKDTQTPAFFKQGKRTGLDYRPIILRETHSCNFITDKEPYIIDLVTKVSSDWVLRVFWNENQIIGTVDPAVIPIKLTSDGNWLKGVLTGDAPDKPDIVYYDYKSESLPESYTCMSENAVCMHGDSLIVGLSSKKLGKPLIWTPNSIDSLDINGFISYVKKEMITKEKYQEIFQ